MQSQAFPAGQCLIRLSVGIGGIFYVLCPAAIASPLPKTIAKTAAPDAAVQALKPDEKLHGENLNGTDQTFFSDARHRIFELKSGSSAASLYPTPELIETTRFTKSTGDIAVESERSSVAVGIAAPSLTSAVLETGVDVKAFSETLPTDIEPADLTVWPDKGTEPLDPTVYSMAHLCSGLQRCEQSVTLSLNAARAMIGGVAANPDFSAVPESFSPSRDAFFDSGSSVDAAIAQNPILSQSNLDSEIGRDRKTEAEADAELGIIRTNPTRSRQDGELGVIRANPTRSRSGDLGILRLLQTAAAAPPAPKQPSTFLIGKLGYLNSGNIFRSDSPVDPRSIDLSNISDQIYQAGLSFYAVPKLSENTSLYAIAETNIVRYEKSGRYVDSTTGSPIRLRSDSDDPLNTGDPLNISYNEVELQLGIRQKLLPRTYAQIGLRNQGLYSPGYRERMLGINYIDTLLSHRAILDEKTWLDAFYQARLGFASDGTSRVDSDKASRFRQTFTLSLNHGFTKDLRTSLLYQLDFEDYTQMDRFDIYQQVLAVISFSATPESRFTLFGGTRFGRSSAPNVNLEDTFYGAGLTVSLPLF